MRRDWLFVFLLVVSCRAVPTAAPMETVAMPTVDVERTLAPLVQATLTAWVSPTSSASPAPTVTASPAVTYTPSPTSTPDPYLAYTIDHLTTRQYGGGEVEIVGTLAENSWFTRYEIRYPSDGLWIYGFLNVPVDSGPAGPGPYPVIIALHGYIDPAIYNTIDYTTRYADALARAGYIVFHPNLRNYPPSDSGDNLYRVGMAVDILNLLAIIQEGVLPGALGNLLAGRIGMWGHSMGGGVTTRVLTVSEKVQAAVLYAAMSGDERQNFEAIQVWSEGARGAEELAAPDAELSRISPRFFYDRISAEVGIHHGRADALVPLSWSVETCDLMTSLGISVECVYYAGMPHTFYGDGDQLFIQNTITFFNRVLKSE